ncbi:hypothetical protein PPYR_04873 [Photinus pyralis]|uniref:C2H2-type domain-containing protein n=1 Tax=Photinus pyralis TaxID=7054 RepID=A0A5N4AZA8_PHOPY|nr:hypothetical protein PPYR_04873 [Photinus pyralis]
MSSLSVSSISSDIVRLTRDLVILLKYKPEILRHISIIKTNIFLIEKVIGDNVSLKNNNENPIKLESNLAILKSYLAKLRQQLRDVSKRGCGIGENNTRNLVWYSLKSCFNSRLLTGIIVNLGYKDPIIFLQRAYDSFARKINIMLKRSMLKVNVILVCNFVNPKNLNIDLKTFATRNNVIDSGSNLQGWYQTNVFDKLRTKLEAFQEEGSGFALSEILHLKVNISSYVPIRGGASTYIKVPHFIALKRAVINVKNNDPFCFLWSVTAALYPVHKDGDRISSYPHFDTVLNRGNIQFPIKLSDIKKFEKLNNLAINLYCVTKKRVVPFMLSTNHDVNGPTINLLVLSSNNSNINGISQSSKRNPNYHFTWIKNMSALLSSQLSKRGHKKFFCNICLNHFSSDNLLQKHSVNCHKINRCSARVPRENEKYLEFTHYSYKESVPFAIYADMESILVKCENNGGGGENTRLYQKHIPFSVAFYLKCTYDDSLSQFSQYRGVDCISWFIKQLHSISIWANSIFDNPIPMETLSATQLAYFQNATHCHICEKPFAEGEIRAKDHNHLTGKMRKSAHVSCNLNYQDSRIIPVVFHNLSGYDAHFIIRELATGIPGQIKLLPINKERYISFTKHVENTNIAFRFIDSFRFMSSSLEKLSSYLSNDKKTITRSFSLNEVQFNLLTRKGVFPYEYIDSWEKLNETELPPRNAFYSHLHNEDITENEYAHALNVWTSFSVQNLGQYSDLYLKTDVLLLADIFENFRKTCLQTYQLDPLHYYTAPGLAFDAMLKITGIRLELLTDIDQVLFIEKGIRGGVTQCTTRYAKANNKYMSEGYDPNLPTNYLMYFDTIQENCMRRIVIFPSLLST